jgi:hypothetical protein
VRLSRKAALQCAVVLLTTPLAGCFWDAPQPAFTIINETDRPLLAETGFGHEIHEQKDADLNGFTLEECRRLRIQAYWPNGQLVASRRSACPDQVWIIVDRGCAGVRPDDTPALRTTWDRKRLGCST